MSRATRIEYPSACYHVMSRGVARRPTFLDDDDRRAFVDILGRLVKRGVIEVHAFCLMPDHYHLLIRTPLGGLARWMRHVNGDYVRGFNLRHRRVGGLWQGRYQAILVEDGPYLTEVSRYIHRNQNRAKLTRPAERYRWSSYRNYVGGPVVAPWVEIRAVLSEFDGARGRYRAYVEERKGEQFVSPFDRAVAGLALGGEAFVLQIRDQLRRRSPQADEPARQRLERRAKATPERVAAAVASEFGGERPRRQRRLLLYALARHSRLRPADVARRQGVSPTAVCLAVRDLEDEARRRPALAAGLRRLNDAVGTIPRRRVP